MGCGSSAAAAVLLVMLAGLCSSDARSLTATHSDGCTKKLLWFMATTTQSNLEYWRYAKVAVLSAKENSPNLIPVLLFGSTGSSASPEAEANMHWFQQNGGIVYHHNLTFIHDLQAVADKGLREQSWPADMEGVYMRLDIPKVVPHLMKQLEDHRSGITNNINQELVLYTDADVMFYHEFDPCKLDKPEFMAIGPEMDRKAASWNELNWNSGVLLINLEGLNEVLPDMIRFANSEDWDFPVMDQSLINEYFKEESGLSLDSLPEAYNYKGYWGCSPDIVLAHWHGPKPERCLNCYIAHREESKTDHDVKACSCPEAYNIIWQRAMQADGGDLYVHLIKDQDRYARLAGDASMIGAF